ncbi:MULTISPECIES: formate/nitrite transporter family protein [Micrococcaceae]|mgnify:FL=1|uniref:formate/nitrite transporter family protein n=1 Tax=Micrococcaceae TaxID=1268 RepID=UPI001615AC51|nr:MULTISPECIES: formate/nitrite transporter family protein [Micrococcaceae]MBB5750635.1 formate/nitrite transporter FocA (FNT family) [Micrococcus sp. TA1]HRO30866.1 formate/nitrite transporter family protein [Citricoccus sp.]HRO92974.1 formate/nitrite transporter family protein [Citricoccus sp.]
MSEDRRRELGENEFAIEEHLQEAFESTMEEGAERLHRTFRAVVITGLFGGMEVGVGVMAYLAVLHETDSHLLAGLAFSVGLIAVLLAHSELFTEDFHIPIMALVTRQASIWKLLRLWSVTLVSNLVGGWVFMWLVMQAFPEWRSTIAEAAHHFVDAPFSLQTACLALLGGSTITLMTRMQKGTTSDAVRVVAAIGGGFLLAGLQLFHSILDSMFIFGAMQSGADITVLQWLGWFGYTAVFNMLGGILLVTALRIVRTKELVVHYRRQSGPDPDAPRGR